MKVKRKLSDLEIELLIALDEAAPILHRLYHRSAKPQIYDVVSRVETAIESAKRTVLGELPVTELPEMIPFLEYAKSKEKKDPAK